MNGTSANTKAIERIENQISRILDDISQELKATGENHNINIPRVEIGSGRSLEQASRAFKNL